MTRRNETASIKVEDKSTGAEGEREEVAGCGRGWSRRLGAQRQEFLKTPPCCKKSREILERSTLLNPNSFQRRLTTSRN